MKHPDHGISQSDIEVFQSELLSDALEEAHLWSCMDDSDFKDEIREGVMNRLVACYNLSTWSQQAFPHPEPDYEPFQD